MASRRTKSIGTKVTPEEYARIHALAGEQPISEWVRAALLKAVEAPAADASTAEQLAAWLCHDEELDRRVHGTPYASIIDRQAPAQRSGVLAALNMVADTLKLLPRESATTRRWSATGRASGGLRCAPRPAPCPSGS